MKLSLFKPKSLVVKKEPPVISVPDIKDYLVKEYEHVNYLKEENEKLLMELKKAKEMQIKYDATLVTLDAYAKRNESYTLKLQEKQNELQDMQNKISQINNELNSYKIKFNNAAITREEIIDEIISDFKNELSEKIKNHKGNLSKNIIYQLINETNLLK